MLSSFAHLCRVGQAKIEIYLSSPLVQARRCRWCIHTGLFTEVSHESRWWSGALPAATAGGWPCFMWAHTPSSRSGEKNCSCGRTCQPTTIYCLTYRVCPVTEQLGRFLLLCLTKTNECPAPVGFVADTRDTLRRSRGGGGESRGRAQSCQQQASRSRGHTRAEPRDCCRFRFS